MWALRFRFIENLNGTEHRQRSGRSAAIRGTVGTTLNFSCLRLAHSQKLMGAPNLVKPDGCRNGS